MKKSSVIIAYLFMFACREPITNNNFVTNVANEVKLPQIIQLVNKDTVSYSSEDSLNYGGAEFIGKSTFCDRLNIIVDRYKYEGFDIELDYYYKKNYGSIGLALHPDYATSVVRNHGYITTFYYPVYVVNTTASHKILKGFDESIIAI